MSTFALPHKVTVWTKSASTFGAPSYTVDVLAARYAERATRVIDQSGSIFVGSAVVYIAPGAAVVPDDSFIALGEYDAELPTVNALPAKAVHGTPGAPLVKVTL